MTNNNKDRGEKLSLRSIRSKFNKLVRRATLATFVERATPKVIAPAIIGSGFLAVTLAGLWTVLPLEAKIIGVVAFAAATAISPFLVKSGSLLVRKKDAIKRLDQDVDANIRPAEVLSGRLTKTADDQEQGLWNAHIQKTWANWGHKLKAKAPHLNLNKYDPYRLRYVAPLCAALAAGIAGENRQTYLTDAFNWERPIPPAEPIDVLAWITPPDLPHLAPEYLDTRVITAEAPNEQASNQEVEAEDGVQITPEPIYATATAHENSTLTIVIAGGDASVSVNGDIITPNQVLGDQGEDRDADLISTEYIIPLIEGEMSIQVEGGPSWMITVIPDDAPFALINEARPNADNPQSIDIICTADDDYGLSTGRIILRAPTQGEPSDDAPSVEDGQDTDIGLGAAELPTITLPRNRICAP